MRGNFKSIMSFPKAPGGSRKSVMGVWAVFQSQKIDMNGSFTSYRNLLIEPTGKTVHCYPTRYRTSDREFVIRVFNPGSSEECLSNLIFAQGTKSPRYDDLKDARTSVSHDLRHDAYKNRRREATRDNSILRRFPTCQGGKVR